MSIPLQIRANFLSTFSWNPHCKGCPHPSASHLQSLSPFLMCREKSSEDHLSGHLQILDLVPGLQNMPADKPNINSVNCSLPCMTHSVHYYLIIYLCLFRPLLLPFPGQNWVSWTFSVHASEKLPAPMTPTSISGKCISPLTLCKKRWSFQTRLAQQTDLSRWY